MRLMHAGTITFDVAVGGTRALHGRGDPADSGSAIWGWHRLTPKCLG